MSNDRMAVAEAFPLFIEPFLGAGVDYHVGVVTTDMESEGHGGRLQASASGDRWLTSDSPNLVAQFRQMATASLEPEDGVGSSEEKGREAIFQALGHHGGPGEFNEGFLRPDLNGWLHVTVITDEEDSTSDQSLPVSSFVEWLRLLKPFPGRLTFNSMVSWTNFQGATRGESYLNISHQIGGHTGQIQMADWPELMALLGGLQTPAIPQGEFFLSRYPVVETIQANAVTTEGVTLVYALHHDFGYDEARNSITFLDPVPPAGSALTITYHVRSML